MKILNLYSGIGGNRHLWGDEHEITAVEIDKNISSIYQEKFPHDKIVNTDAHSYLLYHYEEYDFIWSSPPCPSHSRICYSQKEKKFADMSLYEEIILLQSWFKGKYVVENVIPYYEYLIKPTTIIGRHPYWTNFEVSHLEVKNIDIARSDADELSKYLGIPKPKYKSRLLLRNSVEPKIGLHLLKESQKEKQLNIF
jgi:DNA (cytosine-5)-methyltransferase 1|tara:strand:+ start:10735 stop:11322 length:588 start_codon:yes stop_codon:yes gene_type:complete